MSRGIPSNLPNDEVLLGVAWLAVSRVPELVTPPDMEIREMSFTTSPYEGESNVALAVNGLTVSPPEAPVAHEPVGQPARRLPRHQAWIRLAEEGEYAEFQVMLNFRYPESLNAEFASFDNERIIAALRKVILEHDGWCDWKTGEELPPASQPCKRADFDQAYGAALRDIERRRRKLDVERQAEGANRPEIALKLDELIDEREEADRVHAEAVERFESGEQVCCFLHRLDGEEVLRLLKAINVERGKVVSLVLDGKKS